MGILNSAELSLTTATIAELPSAMAKGTLTSEKLTDTYLARIAAYDQQGPINPSPRKSSSEQSSKIFLSHA